VFTRRENPRVNARATCHKAAAAGTRTGRNQESITSTCKEQTGRGVGKEEDVGDQHSEQGANGQINMGNIAIRGKIHT